MIQELLFSAMSYVFSCSRYFNCTKSSREASENKFMEPKYKDSVCKCSAAALFFSSLSKISNKLSAGNSSKAFPVGVKHFIDSN